MPVVLRGSTAQGHMMIGLVLGWGFAAFLYFKIVMDAAFYSGVSVIASLLMATILALLVFFISGVYAIKLASFRFDKTASDGSWGSILGRTILPFILSAIGYFVVSRLVVFGFSKDLSKHLRMFGYRGQLEEDFVVFAIIVIAPVVIHYLMILFSARRMAAR